MRPLRAARLANRSGVILTGRQDSRVFFVFFEPRRLICLACKLFSQGRPFEPPPFSQALPLALSIYVCLPFSGPQATHRSPLSWHVESGVLMLFKQGLLPYPVNFCQAFFTQSPTWLAAPFFFRVEYTVPFSHLACGGAPAFFETPLGQLQHPVCPVRLKGLGLCWAWCQIPDHAQAFEETLGSWLAWVSQSKPDNFKPWRASQASVRPRNQDALMRAVIAFCLKAWVGFQDQ